MECVDLLVLIRNTTRRAFAHILCCLEFCVAYLWLKCIAYEYIVICKIHSLSTNREKTQARLLHLSPCRRTAASHRTPDIYWPLENKLCIINENTFNAQNDFQIAFESHAQV